MATPTNETYPKTVAEFKHVIARIIAATSDNAPTVDTVLAAIGFTGESPAEHRTFLEFLGFTYGSRTLHVGVSVSTLTLKD